ncbi:MAG: ABC transporter substrate-binding protein [Oscillospiraceae bacterium]|nr:ABC transporter substrate-binding protein [Oscillospiraceae bacterium]
MKRTLCIFFGLVMILFALSACGGNNNPAPTPLPTPPTETSSPPVETAAPPVDTQALPAPAPEPPVQESRNRPDVDREGFAITLPDEINTIISIGPSNTEILVALGFGDEIIAADRFSDGIPGLSEGVATLELLLIDAEFLIDLNPDIIFVTGLTRARDDDNPLRVVSDAGISIVYVPTSTSIAAIMEDIRFLAAVMDAHDMGEDIISDMQTELDAIREIAATITEPRTVYFEISPAPTMWSLGTNTFIHEMIELIGAENIFADKDGWVGVADEIVLYKNPDVIITSVNFIDDPVEDIVRRPGWGAITAVQNDDVFQVTTNYVNRANHNIINGLREIATVVYPDYFQ